MNEQALIQEFREHFGASKIDEEHMHNDEYLMGPFKPLIVSILGKPVGCVDLRKQPNTVDGYVELAYIYIYEKQQGHGSAIIKKICKLADEYKLEVELDAVPISKSNDPIPQWKLHAFYREFKFKNSEVQGSNMMTRYPNA